jgi:hypothetical protein
MIFYQDAKSVNNPLKNPAIVARPPFSTWIGLVTTDLFVHEIDSDLLQILTDSEAKTIRAARVTWRRVS